jgi:hypothetical protein
LINCKIGKEISYSCATEIRIAVFTGPPIASVLWSITAGLNFIFIYSRSILIISAPLRIFTPNVALVSGIPGKDCVYFLPVMRATASSHLLINTTKFVVTSPLHWFPEIFFEEWWLYFQRAESSS